jgi:hypothetical protein
VTLRTRLFVLISALVVVTVGLVTGIVSARARTAFRAGRRARRAAFVAQFRRDFAREATRSFSVSSSSPSDTVRRLAIELAKSGGDYAEFVERSELDHRLQPRLPRRGGPERDDRRRRTGRARFGYRHPWATTAKADPFLEPVELPNELALGLVGVRTVTAGDRRLDLAGGRRVDQQFLRSLVLPEGMRALLYRNLDPEVSGRQLVDAEGPVSQASALEPLIARVRQSAAEATETIPRPGGSEVFHAIPLTGREGACSACSWSGAPIASCRARATFDGAGLTIVVWRAVRPDLQLRARGPHHASVEQLADAARRIAGADGMFSRMCRPREINALATAFTTMTRQLVRTTRAAGQAERVAAWRELARRLAHELKNPLFRCALRWTISVGRGPFLPESSTRCSPRAWAR